LSEFLSSDPFPIVTMWNLQIKRILTGFISTNGGQSS
jgi:hypothetical protein